MAASSERWYRQPVVWLAASILFGSIAACIGLILLAARLPADLAHPAGDTVLYVPVAPNPPHPP